MKTFKNSTENTDKGHPASFDYGRSEREAEQISSRFKGSSDVKAAMGSRMGVDFSDIRIHSDPDANLRAESMGALAFTRGSDIYMNSSDSLQEDGTPQGQVLAHELTHTVQQGAAPQFGGAISQAAPSGTTQMLFGRRRKKAAAAAAAMAAPVTQPRRTPLPPATTVTRVPAPKTADGHNDFSSFVNPGKALMGEMTANWKKDPTKGLKTNYSNLLTHAHMRDSEGGLNLSTNAAYADLLPLVRENANTDVDLNGALAMPNYPAQLAQMGRDVMWQDPRAINAISNITSSVLGKLDQYLDNPDVASLFQAQDQILSGTQGNDAQELMNSPVVRGNTTINEYVLRQASPAYLERRNAYNAQGDFDRAGVVTKFTGGLQTQLNAIAMALLKYKDTPDFDFANIDQNTATIISDEIHDNDTTAHSSASPALVQQYGKILSKTMNISAQRTATSEPSMPPAPAELLGDIPWDNSSASGMQYDESPAHAELLGDIPWDNSSASGMQYDESPAPAHAELLGDIPWDNSSASGMQYDESPAHAELLGDIPWDNSSASGMEYSAWGAPAPQGLLPSIPWEIPSGSGMTYNDPESKTDIIGNFFKNLFSRKKK